MTQNEAEHFFLRTMVDFCRAHRHGDRVDPLVAQSALEWEIKLGNALTALPPAAATRLADQPVKLPGEV